jgi:cation transport regulator
MSNLEYWKMPKNQSSSKKVSRSTRLSTRTKKQIDTLPQHAQHIFKKAHDSALKQYQDPAKRRGGKNQSAEVVAHKTAWAAVKKKSRSRAING